MTVETETLTEASDEPLGRAATPMPGALGPLAGDLATASLVLARRFAAGATMWCCAPDWPAHARHVAVEFVHPVIVGKRALPASVVPGPDPVAALRLLARSGDILLVVGDAHNAVVADAVRRARAWGLTTVWVGAGARPPAGAADQTLWLPGDDPMAPYSGQYVLLYHLLWELTHVCFEHPGLLVETEPECTEDVCITCSDEGRLAEVVFVTADGAQVRTPAGSELVDTTMVGDVAPGDLILVHAGTAITVLDRTVESGGHPS